MDKQTRNKILNLDEVTDLMSITNVGDYLGWHRAKVNTYRRRAEDESLKRRVEFPKPYVYLASRAYWTKEQIIKFAENNRERLGSESEYVKQLDTTGN